MNNLNTLAALIPVIVALISLAGSTIAIIATLPKTRADATNTQAQAAAQLVSAFEHLATAQSQRIADLQAQLTIALEKASLCQYYERQIEQLETELRQARRTRTIEVRA